MAIVNLHPIRWFVEQLLRGFTPIDRILNILYHVDVLKIGVNIRVIDKIEHF